MMPSRNLPPTIDRFNHLVETSPSNGDSWIPVTPDTSDGGFGDTDLVEALLYSPKQMRQRAVYIIAQQTGLSDIQLMERETNGSVPVRFGGKTFGHLECGQRRCRYAQAMGQLARSLACIEDAQSTLRQMAYRDELTRVESSISEPLPLGKHRGIQTPQTTTDGDGLRHRRLQEFQRPLGHDAGDIILRETIRLLGSVIRAGDRVCRIGGDEFAVVFDLEAQRSAGSTHPDSVEKIACRFQAQIGRMRFPRLGLQAPGTLSVSGGLASYPWDASDPAGLLHAADQRALESKRRGKNFLTIGPGASFTREDDTPPSPTGPPA